MPNFYNKQATFIKFDLHNSQSIYKLSAKPCKHSTLNNKVMPRNHKIYGRFMSWSALQGIL